jgi:pimeloyl-ACP methyl ester carboxylesterase
VASPSHRITDVRRRQGAERAILFLHGFSGDHQSTWGCFPFIVGTDPSLADWDILSLGFATNLLPDIRSIWSADPDLPGLALHLHTRLENAPLAEYNSLALVAHSMGGLVVQRALVDDPTLRSRVSYLLMFGTPSNGLRKAGFFAFLKPQLKNMAEDGDFIRQLRTGWASRYRKPTFKLFAIAGDRDEFVPRESSIYPFAQADRRMVAGDHLSMVKPQDGKAESVSLLIGALTAKAEPPAVSAPLRTSAAEMTGPEIRQALAERASGLTQAEVVNAALELDRKGQGEEAIALLKSHLGRGTDISGTLGGRFKRRWLATGDQADAVRASELYRSALDASSAANDHDQAYYHAINLAFLSYLVWDQKGEAVRLAALALEHCRQAPKSIWRVATEAEAHLYLGKVGLALATYGQLFGMGAEHWQIQSTGLQAYQVAHKLGDHALEETLLTLFNPEIAQRSGRERVDVDAQVRGTEAVR